MAVLTTCPRCGSPAQRETAPSGESYTTCGHCATVVLDATGESLDMDEVVRLAISMGGEPMPDERGLGHRIDPEIAPYDYTDIDRATCYMCDRADCICDSIDIPSVLEVDEPDSEFHAQAESPTRVNWSSGPILSPVDALRLALERGIFGLPETVDKLRASLAAADQKAIDDAEQLAHARDSVAINLQMRQIEAALFDLPC